MSEPAASGARASADTALTAITLTLRRPPSGWRRWLQGILAPQLLFPAVALLLLGLIWGTTLNLMKVERSAARAQARASTLQLADTYQAQVVRALREIDQTLKLVKYVYEGQGHDAALAQLKSRALLPPDLLFSVTVLDAQGKLIASNGASAPAIDPSYRAALQSADALWVSRPSKDSASGEWKLQFGRSLRGTDDGYAGAVIETVDADYFVSGYDPQQLGQHGMLGMLGTDGRFRVRRSGDDVSADDAADYSAILPDEGQTDPMVYLRPNRWDQVSRYTAVERVFQFPLAVVVGLSEAEQLSATRHDARIYLERAASGSAVVVLLTVLLGRLSGQVVRSRELQARAELQHAQRIEYLAYHDGLTALPNRSLFNKLLSQSVSQAERYHRSLAVAFIDLDRFKQINDTLGHEAGDALLKDVAVRLKACLRESDIVARLGGDEFVVLMPELADQGDAATVAGKIVAAVAKPYLILGQELRVTASIGISVYPKDGRTEQALTKNADVAMYQAKEEGKNNFQFYSEKLAANSLERQSLESGLRHALERQEFKLHYQAKRDMASGRITGTEALLRWEHPDLGLVPPMQFLPVAEETGLILPIGRWVLQTACRQNVAWQKEGLAPLRVAINLSAKQFSDEGLIDDIKSALAASGMDATLLEVEIHESLLIRDIDKALRTLHTLKDMGVKIAIDDFGAGYSSLATLRQFPLDTIKIDRSFIKGVATVAEDSTLADAIIAMGKRLSLTVVAQGVETRAQADFLRAHACDELQGFYFQKPVSARQLGQLLQQQSGSAASMTMETSALPDL